MLLDRLWLGKSLACLFEVGDNWQHQGTAADDLVDPMETLCIIPDRQLPRWGWGSIPDQHGGRFGHRR